MPPNSNRDFVVPAIVRCKGHLPAAAMRSHGKEHRTSGCRPMAVTAILNGPEPTVRLGEVAGMTVLCVPPRGL